MSQIQRPRPEIRRSESTRSEFLGLHDPYGDTPVGGTAAAPRPVTPLVDKEKAGELVRAGGMLTVLFMLIAVVITAIG